MVNEWIYVGDRQPEDQKQDVLVLLKGNSVPSVMTRSGAHWQWAVYWMPLPQPPSDYRRRKCLRDLARE